MFKQARYYLSPIPFNNRMHLIILFVGLLITTVLEMMSLAIIPGFVAIIIDAENLINFLPSTKIVSYLNSYEKNELVIIFSIISFLCLCSTQFKFSFFLSLLERSSVNSITLRLIKSISLSSSSHDKFISEALVTFM